MTAARRRAFRRGFSAERLAALFLMTKGYRILARRYRTPIGEIDLIARRGKTIAFVEVKRRARKDAGEWAVTPRAERRIGAAASLWLSRHPAAMGMTQRFDLVLVAPMRLPLHLADAFRPPE
ncbi:YraN family protein [Afifella sp. IM 167]|uniref:YraN family protein n=1 Tax=Afifella sp. IM 167 TaxID=2033586 RepID=UPI001CCD90F4|nr:YraN family protein [Afifella sp. IM 167]MBZ8133542.1 YraN family protein [Afifella sp. IM 167]